MCRLGLCTAIALCVCSLSATAGERFGEWSLEQTGDFVFALSFKQSVSFDDRIATSELAFVCDEKEKYVAGPAYTVRWYAPKPAEFDSRSYSEDRRVF